MANALNAPLTVEKLKEFAYALGQIKQPTIYHVLPQNALQIRTGTLQPTLASACCLTSDKVMDARCHQVALQIPYTTAHTANATSDFTQQDSHAHHAQEEQYFAGRGWYYR